MSNVIVSRADAAAIGLKRYFTGEACPFGHVAERYTGNGNCVVCNAYRAKAWQQENKERESETAAAYREKNQGRIAQKKREWVERNHEHVLRVKAAHYHANKDRYTANTRAWRKQNPDRVKGAMTEWRRLNVDHIRSYNQANSPAINARTVARRARKKQAAPPWLSSQQYEQIESFYALAKQLELETGIKHQVDHIVPLMGELVSGLHVPWNLQVLTASANKSKGNRFVV